MGFTDTSLLWRLAYFISILGFCLTLAGLTSRYLLVCELLPNMWQHIGFWDMCDDTQSFSCRTVEDYLEYIGDSRDWLYGSRAMALIGILIQGFIPIMSVYLTYTASSNATAALVIAIFNTLAVIFSSIGITIFMVFAVEMLERTVEMESTTSWSLVVFILGQVCALFAAMVNFYDACNDRL